MMLASMARVLGRTRGASHDRGEAASIILQDFYVDFDAQGPSVLDAEVHVNCPCSAVCNVSLHPHIPDVCLCAAAVEKDIARDPRQPPHVLVFDKSGIIPAQHHEGEGVYTAMSKVRCQVEL
jgi:hypothetical protein